MFALSLLTPSPLLARLPRRAASGEKEEMEEESSLFFFFLLGGWLLLLLRLGGRLVGEWMLLLGGGRGPMRGMVPFLSVPRGLGVSKAVFVCWCGRGCRWVGGVAGWGWCG